MNPRALDIIGDIHGQHDKLTALLTALGYVYDASAWRHPEGRRVLFLGDFIDRGPRIRRVLETVRGMCDAGSALAIMGNHEYNAICYHTAGGHGGFLRPRVPKNRQQHAMTLAEFFDRRAEWDGWLEWMKALPMYLEVEGLRAVHAAWDPAAIRVIAGRSLTDPAFLHATAVKGSAEFRAVETLLKGIEIDLPEGASYQDKDGHRRRAVRSRWWLRAAPGLTYRDLVFPPSVLPPEEPVDPAAMAALPGYEPGEPPVFFGHYWMPAGSPLGPLAPNVACLDYSAAKDGPLVACRWNGEPVLTPEQFVIAGEPGQ